MSDAVQSQMKLGPVQLRMAPETISIRTEFVRGTIPQEFKQEKEPRVPPPSEPFFQEGIYSKY